MSYHSFFIESESVAQVVLELVMVQLPQELGLQAGATRPGTWQYNAPLKISPGDQAWPTSVFVPLSVYSSVKQA